jgi:hypothetical protein
MRGRVGEKKKIIIIIHLLGQAPEGYWLHLVPPGGAVGDGAQLSQTPIKSFEHCSDGIIMKRYVRSV